MTHMAKPVLQINPLVLKTAEILNSRCAKFGQDSNEDYCIFLQLETRTATRKQPEFTLKQNLGRCNTAVSKFARLPLKGQLNWEMRQHQLSAVPQQFRASCVFPVRKSSHWEMEFWFLKWTPSPRAALGHSTSTVPSQCQHHGPHSPSVK